MPRAGPVFSVGRIKRNLIKGNFSNRIVTNAAVYLTRVLEYLAAEVLYVAGDSAHQHKKKRIIPRHILLAVGQDSDLNELFRNVYISEGGVFPRFNYLKEKQRSPIRLEEHVTSGEMDLKKDLTAIPEEAELEDEFVAVKETGEPAIPDEAEVEGAVKEAVVDDPPELPARPVSPIVVVRYGNMEFATEEEADEYFKEGYPLFD